jgi:hypothetical protein
VIVDDTFHRSRYGCHHLTRVHHVDGHALRVRVSRRLYDTRSQAGAEILTPQHAWTALASTPCTDRHHATPATTTTAAPLTPIADQLLQRARHIVTLPQRPPRRRTGSPTRRPRRRLLVLTSLAA